MAAGTAIYLGLKGYQPPYWEEITEGFRSEKGADRELRVARERKRLADQWAKKREAEALERLNSRGRSDEEG